MSKIFLQRIYRVNVVVVCGEVHVISITVDCQQEGAWWNRSVDKRRELSEDQAEQEEEGCSRVQTQKAQEWW